MNKKPKKDGPAERVGDISPDERKRAQVAYNEHCQVCRRYGVTAELFERYLAEFVEDARKPQLETPADVDRLAPRRSYERQFEGKRGFDVAWITNK